MGVPGLPGLGGVVGPLPTLVGNCPSEAVKESIGGGRFFVALCIKGVVALCIKLERPPRGDTGRPSDGADTARLLLMLPQTSTNPDRTAATALAPLMAGTVGDHAPPSLALLPALQPAMLPSARPARTATAVAPAPPSRAPTCGSAPVL